MVGFIILWILCSWISSALGADPVVFTIVSALALIALLGIQILFWRWWERDPRGHSGDAIGLRGASGVSPYGGGAVAVGFRDAATVSTPPPVPDDDPHRIAAPDWAALPSTGESNVPPPIGLRAEAAEHPDL
jgi:hypothetical protein